jgi:hypothetical protein
MTSNDDSREIREVVGVFDSVDAFESAIDDLLSSGFDQSEISLLAAEETVDKKLGHKYTKVSEVEDNEAVPRTHYVQPEMIAEAQGALIGGLVYVGAIATVGAVVASGGALASVIAGAALAGAGGGLIGAVLAKLLGQHHARQIEEQLKRGGMVLWVRAFDPEHESRAMTILSQHSGRDVHVHAAA